MNWYTEINIEDEDEFNSMAYPDLKLSGKSPLFGENSFSINSELLFPLKISNGEVSNWLLAVNLSDLIECAAKQGVIITKVEHVPNKVIFSTLNGLPYIGNLSFILHTIYELDSIKPLPVTYREDRFFLDIIDKVLNVEPCSYLLYSNLVSQYDDEGDIPDEIVWGNIFMDISMIQYDYLIPLLNKKSIPPRLVEVIEWIKSNFDVDELQELSNEFQDIGFDKLLESSESMKSYVSTYSKTKLAEFIGTEITTSQLRAIQYLAQKCGSYLLPLFCIYKQRNSTSYASFVMNEHTLDYLDYEDLDKSIDYMNLHRKFKNQYSVCYDFVTFLDENPDEDQSLINLVQYGESKTLEFKATAKFSIRKGQDDKDLYYAIIKNICAMANTDGGTILVGYDEDNRDFVGIEADGFKNNDQWENYIRNKIKDKSGNITGTLVDIIFKKHVNSTCALIEVKRAYEPIYCNEINSKTKVLYVRTGASTRSLGADEIISYSKDRF